MKIVCLSFDDGTVYDLRFIELLNKYNLKATFNLNSQLDGFTWLFNSVFPVTRLCLKEVKDKYEGHEVASHSLTHPYFTSLKGEDVVLQVSKDVENLSEIFGYQIEGFAFPFSDQTEEHIQTVSKNVNLKYIRYTDFRDDILPKDRYHIHMNAYYNDEKIYEKLENFKKNTLKNSLFVIVGHSYELETLNEWEKVEKLLQYLAKDDEICVLTMKNAVDIIFG